MADNKPKFAYDIQKNEYTEGSENFNVEMKDEGYIFQFDRLYTIHDRDVKTYKFKAKLTPETIAKEQEQEEGEFTNITDEQNAPFKWLSLDNEIWHIETTAKDYNNVVKSLWANIYDENGNRVSEEEEKQINETNGVKYYEEMDVILNNETFHLPEDWTGRNKIYFITDVNSENNLDMNEEYYTAPAVVDGIVNDAINTIRNALDVLVLLNTNYNDVSAAGIVPEEYGFSNRNGKLVKN